MSGLELIHKRLVNRKNRCGYNSEVKGHKIYFCDRTLEAGGKPCSAKDWDKCSENKKHSKIT